ncbi:unnamed protein product, partial [Urochloa humidicola]
KNPKAKPLSPSSSRLAELSVGLLLRARRLFAPLPFSLSSPKPMEALAGTAASSSILPVRHPPSRLAPQSLALRASRCGPLRASGGGGGGGKEESQAAPAANGSPVLKLKSDSS